MALITDVVTIETGGALTLQGTATFALPAAAGGTPVTQGPDNANAAGTATTVALSDHVHNISAAAPSSIGTGNSKGTNASFALSDHIHDHGSQSTGTHHAAVTTSVNGFMSAADKTKLDADTMYLTTGTVANNSNSVWATISTFPTITLATGTYIFEADIIAQSAATTTGMGLRLNVNTATATFMGMWGIPSAATVGTDSITEYAQVSGTIPNLFSATSAVATTNMYCRGRGQIIVTVAGSIIVQFVNEVNNSAVTIQANSVLKLTKVA